MQLWQGMRPVMLLLLLLLSMPPAAATGSIVLSAFYVPDSDTSTQVTINPNSQYSILATGTTYLQLDRSALVSTIEGRDTLLAMSLNLQFAPGGFSGPEYGLIYMPLHPYDLNAETYSDLSQSFRYTYSVCLTGTGLTVFAHQLARAILTFPSGVLESKWGDESWVAIRATMLPADPDNEGNVYTVISNDIFTSRGDLAIQYSPRVSAVLMYNTTQAALNEAANDYTLSAVTSTDDSPVALFSNVPGIQTNAMLLQFAHGQMPMGARGFRFQITAASLDDGVPLAASQFSVMAFASRDFAPFLDMYEHLRASDCLPAPLQTTHPGARCTENSFYTAPVTGQIDAGSVVIDATLPWRFAVPLWVMVSLDSNTNANFSGVYFIVDSAQLTWLELDTEVESLVTDVIQVFSTDGYNAVVQRSFDTGAPLDFRVFAPNTTSSLLSSMFPLRANEHDLLLLKCRLESNSGRHSHANLVFQALGVHAVVNQTSTGATDFSALIVDADAYTGCMLSDSVYASNTEVPWQNGINPDGAWLYDHDNPSSVLYAASSNFATHLIHCAARQALEPVVTATLNVADYVSVPSMNLPWLYTDVSEKWIAITASSLGQPYVYLASSAIVKPVYRSMTINAADQQTDTYGFTPFDLGAAGMSILVTRVDPIALFGHNPSAPIFDVSLVCEQAGDGTTIAVNTLAYEGSAINNAAFFYNMAEGIDTAATIYYGLDGNVIGPTTYSTVSGDPPGFEFGVHAFSSTWVQGVRTIMIRASAPISGCEWVPTPMDRKLARWRPSFDDFYLTSYTVQLIEPAFSAHLLSNRHIYIAEIDHGQLPWLGDSADSQLKGWNAVHIGFDVEVRPSAVGTVYRLAVSADMDNYAACADTHVCSGTVVVDIETTGSQTMYSVPRIIIPRIGIDGWNFRYIHIGYVSVIAPESCQKKGCGLHLSGCSCHNGCVSNASYACCDDYSVTCDAPGPNTPSGPSWPDASERGLVGVNIWTNTTDTARRLRYDTMQTLNTRIESAFTIENAAYVPEDESWELNQSVALKMHNGAYSVYVLRDTRLADAEVAFELLSGYAGRYSMQISFVPHGCDFWAGNCAHSVSHTAHLDASEWTEIAVPVGAPINDADYRVVFEVEPLIEGTPLYIRFVRALLEPLDETSQTTVAALTTDTQQPPLTTIDPPSVPTNPPAPSSDSTVSSGTRLTSGSQPSTSGSTRASSTTSTSTSVVQSSTVTTSLPAVVPSDPGTVSSLGSFRSPGGVALAAIVTAAALVCIVAVFVLKLKYASLAGYTLVPNTSEL